MVPFELLNALDLYFYRLQFIFRSKIVETENKSNIFSATFTKSGQRAHFIVFRAETSVYYHSLSGNSGLFLCRWKRHKLLYVLHDNARAAQSQATGKGAGF